MGRHVEQGYKRIKLKIEPGWDIDMLSAVRSEFPDIELTVDANSAYTLDDLDVLHRSTASVFTTSSSRCTGTTSPIMPRSPRR